jgi:hypothetical protein
MIQSFASHLLDICLSHASHLPVVCRLSDAILMVIVFVAVSVPHPRFQESTFATLQFRYGFTLATDTILTGCSAGGIGAILNCDFVGKQAPPGVSQHVSRPRSP